MGNGRDVPMCCLNHLIYLNGFDTNKDIDMFFQQELWLVIVGLIVAYVVRKFNGSTVAFKKIALWACAMSLVVGELGMVTQLFFPSDVMGFLFTTLAALIASKIVIGDKTAANQSRPAQQRSRKRKA